MTTGHSYGFGSYGSSPYGSVLAPFGVVSVVSVGPYEVVVQFNALLDFTYPAVLDPGTYFIPELQVLLASRETAASVRLLTGLQAEVLYTLTVVSARGLYGQLIDSSLKSARFLGLLQPSAFEAVAVSSTKVRAVFSSSMSSDLNLSTVGNYTVTDMFGNVLPILSVIPEQTSSPISVAITLATALVSTNSYQLTVAPAVKAAIGTPMAPATAGFYWVEDVGPAVVPFARLSGETFGDLLGSPAGQVFFSPALEEGVTNSVIQVEEISVCTIAYDSYLIPQAKSFSPLYTLVPGRPPQGLLGPGGTVLWGPFPSLSPVTFALSSDHAGPFESDTVPAVVDTSVVASLRQPWDPTYVALLNNPAWKTFDGVDLTGLFMTARNAAPIPPGSLSTVLVLFEHLAADSGLLLVSSFFDRSEAIGIRGGSSVLAVPS